MSAISCLNRSHLRCLGVYVLFSDLRVDGLFQVDVIGVVMTAMTNDNLVVRTRAAWAIGMHICR